MKIAKYFCLLTNLLDKGVSLARDDLSSGAIRGGYDPLKHNHIGGVDPSLINEKRKNLKPGKTGKIGKK